MIKLFEWMLDKISVRTLSNCCVAILIITAVLTANDIARGISGRGGNPFGGQEVVEVHITPEGLLRAISRLSITHCPSSVTCMPLSLPQKGARLESVTVDGRSVPFESGQGGPEALPNTYYAMPSLPENAMRDALVEVTWSVPLSELRTDKGLTRFPVQGVIPVRSFAANVVIDEGAPYKFGGNIANQNNYTMIVFRQEKYTQCSIGWCDIELLDK